MNKAAILEKLNQHSGEILDRFGAKHLSLFGSAARDELRDDSDIDVLVEFERPATYDGYFDLKNQWGQSMGSDSIGGQSMGSDSIEIL